MAPQPASRFVAYLLFWSRVDSMPEKRSARDWSIMERNVPPMAKNVDLSGTRSLDGFSTPLAQTDPGSGDSGGWDPAELVDVLNGWFQKTDPPAPTVLSYLSR
jgi:hypothetical protein